MYTENESTVSEYNTVTNFFSRKFFTIQGYFIKLYTTTGFLHSFFRCSTGYHNEIKFSLLFFCSNISPWSYAQNDFVFFIYFIIFGNDQKYMYQGVKFIRFIMLNSPGAKFTRCRVYYLCWCRVHHMPSSPVTLQLYCSCVCLS